jgi:signal transduction histidine kinase
MTDMSAGVPASPVAAASVRSSTRSVRVKLLLVVVATTLAALMVTGVSMVWYDARSYRQFAIDDLLTQADIIARASTPALAFDDPKVANETLALLKAKPNIVEAAIYTPRGNVFATFPPDSFEVPRLPEVDGVHVDGRDLTLFKRIVDRNQILGTVYLRAEYALADRIATYLAILGVVMIGSLAIAVLMSSWLNRSVTGPIRSIGDVARRVSESRDFSLRATRTTDDEVGDLVDGFNAMLAEIARRSDVLEESHRSLEHAENELQQLNADLEQRVARRTAELQAANKEMETFSYSVSHDLRAPVRAIVGFSQILREDHGDALDDEGKRKLAIIQDEARRMGQLIDDLLAFSRLGRQAIEPVQLDMTEMARRMFERLNTQDGSSRAELRLDALPGVVADRALIDQVWANLLANAIKYSAKREHPLVEVGAISDDVEHIYYVRDNGAGFDPRYKAKLFGVFQRLHNASEFTGTGVGLALVQRIVLRHHGRVWADGKPDQGASFYFALPKENQDAER